MKFRYLAALCIPTFAAAFARTASADPLQCAAEVLLPKKAAIPFTPFPLVNLKTGEHYQPTQMIDVGEGKDARKVSASDYFASLNGYEQQLNAIGYTLRDSSTAPVLKKLEECAPLLQAQNALLKADHDKAPPSLLDLEARAKELEDKWNTYKQNIPSWDDLWAKAGNSTTSVYLPAPPPFTASVPTPMKAEPKDVFKKRTWSFEQGDPAKFYVGGNAYVAMTGSREITTLEAGSAFNSGVMGLWKGEVASAKAIATAGKSQDPKLSLDVRVVDKSVWNPTYTGPAASPGGGGTPGSKLMKLLHKSDTYSVSVDKGVDWRFAIGPVPCRGRLGFNGTAGIAYGYDIAPTAVGGFAAPFAHADAYAQLGVDIGVAGAGVDARLHLLHDTLTLRGDASIDFVDEPRVQLDLSASNTLEALSGSFSAYAYIDLFLYKWTGSYEIWSFGGYKNTADIFHFKYVWTPGGIRAEGDVQAEDLADVAAQTHELQVAQLVTESYVRANAVVQAVATDLGSAQVGVVATEPTRVATAANAIDTNVTTYLTELQKWLGT